MDPGTRFPSCPHAILINLILHLPKRVFLYNLLFKTFLFSRRCHMLKILVQLASFFFFFATQVAQEKWKNQRVWKSRNWIITLTHNTSLGGCRSSIIQDGGHGLTFWVLAHANCGVYSRKARQRWRGNDNLPFSHSYSKGLLPPLTPKLETIRKIRPILVSFLLRKKLGFI